MPTFKSEYYQPGDVLYQGEPFVKVIHRDLWDKICANCYGSTACLKRCGACRIMKYCGQSCQKKAWPEHKLECPFLRNCRSFKHQTCVQMIGNVILKINGRDWKTVTECLVDKEFSFDDLVSHTGTKIGPEYFFDIKALKDDVESYIGKENLPNEEDLIEIIGKVYYNTFSFCPQNAASAFYDCRALFIAVSKLDHSCVPNSTRGFNGKVLGVRASKVIHKSEKITIAYGSMVTKLDCSLLHMNMKKNFLESCYCSDCSQPFGKSPLTNIIDESKAMAVLQETDSTLMLISLLAQLKYPVGIVTRDKLSQLLQKQDGVLGKTNLRRMRTLSVKALFTHGPIEEMKKELVELADAMKEALGEYYEELLPVYQKLMTISMTQNNVREVTFYSEKIAQLNRVCFGFALNKEGAEFQLFMKAINHFGFFIRR